MAAIVEVKYPRKKPERIEHLWNGAIGAFYTETVDKAIKEMVIIACMDEFSVDVFQVTTPGMITKDLSEDALEPHITEENYATSIDPGETFQQHMVDPVDGPLELVVTNVGPQHRN
jgi:hypothetical protein